MKLTESAVECLILDIIREGKLIELNLIEK